MQPSKTKKDNSIESFGRLIQIMRNDKEINKQVLAVLELDSYQRRKILNNWLEGLRIKDAPPNFQDALAALFDDKVALQVLELIKKD